MAGRLRTGPVHAVAHAYPYSSRFAPESLSGRTQIQTAAGPQARIAIGIEARPGLPTQVPLLDMGCLIYADIDDTWAATMRQPCGRRSQAWLWRPITAVPSRVNSVFAVA
ncbi:MAG: hypothetical protein JWP59_3677 [Massilia sp.]|nr:hypothetical protein [Massilia sp.]